MPAAREARADLEAELRALPRRVDRLEKLVKGLDENLRERAELAAAPVTIPPAEQVPIWRDEVGRAWALKVVGMVCATLIIVAGIAGGIVTALPEGALTAFGS